MNFHFKKKERFLIIILLLSAMSLHSIALMNRKESKLKIHIITEAPAKHFNSKPDKFDRENNLLSSRKIIDSIPESIDINSIDSSSIVNLGFSSFFARNLCRYRAKGACFKSWSDLEKIYGVDLDVLNSIKDNLLFAPCKDERRNMKIVNINTADSTELSSLYGIGAVLSSRIIKYRSRLGGFHSVEQLTEVYGINDEVFSRNDGRIICEGPVRKINLNSVQLDSLLGHYYFDRKTAHAIMNYAKHHGPFKGIEELKNIRTLSDSVFNKIYPYCAIN